MRDYFEYTIEFIPNEKYRKFRDKVDKKHKKRGNNCRYCGGQAPRGKGYCTDKCKRSMKELRRAIRNIKKCNRCEIILGGKFAGWGDGKHCDKCLEREILELLQNLEQIL